jgi:diguanylate cyclase (GGDEF)-like protein
MFGVDHFDHYVQRNGLQAGDRLLRGVAQVVRPLVKDGEMLARWSGEEFVAFLPDVDLQMAWALGTRVRSAVSGVQWPFAEDQPGGRVTLRAAIATYPEAGESLEEIVEAAARTLAEARASASGAKSAEATSARPVAAAGAAVATPTAEAPAGAASGGSGAAPGDGTSSATQDGPEIEVLAAPAGASQA